MNYDDLPDWKKAAANDPPPEEAASDQAFEAWKALLRTRHVYADESLTQPPATPESPEEPVRDPKLPAIPTDPCPQCGDRQYWRPKTGPFVCNRCNPPPKPDHEFVEEWWYIVPEIA